MRPYSSPELRVGDTSADCLHGAGARRDALQTPAEGILRDVQLVTEARRHRCGCSHHCSAGACEREADVTRIRRLRLATLAVS